MLLTGYLHTLIHITHSSGTTTSYELRTFRIGLGPQQPPPGNMGPQLSLTHGAVHQGRRGPHRQAAEVLSLTGSRHPELCMHQQLHRLTWAFSMGWLLVNPIPKLAELSGTQWNSVELSWTTKLWWSMMFTWEMVRDIQMWRCTLFLGGVSPQNVTKRRAWRASRFNYTKWKEPSKIESLPSKCWDAYAEASKIEAHH